MAKKLIHDYTFTAASNKVVLSDIIQRNKLLLITNVKDGITIYQFNSSSQGLSNYETDTEAKTTTLTLTYDCSGMEDSDELQIFVEQDAVKIAPSETYTDPVSKLRISNPENLIDTDFEYGLQPSKWETLELVKNVPTFFSRDGDTGLEISDITTTNGSDEVQVTLISEHGFAPGAPIIVKGTNVNSCNGSFVATRTPTTTSFSYKAKAVQTSTGSIKDTYSEIYYGSIYQGTEFKLSGLDAITTDNTTPSTLTASTESPTDFKEGTSFFLTNSLGTVNHTFDASTVVADNKVTAIKTFAVAADSTRTGRQRTNGFQTYAWTGAGSFMYLPSEITLNSTDNTITVSSNNIYNGHGLRDRMAYLWSSGIGNQFGNIAQSQTSGTADTLNKVREKIFYVRTINNTTFYLSEDFNSTTRYNITDTTIVDGGLFKLELMEAFGITGRDTGTSGALYSDFSHDAVTNPSYYLPNGYSSSYSYNTNTNSKINAYLPPPYLVNTGVGITNGFSGLTWSNYTYNFTQGTGDDNRIYVRLWGDNVDVTGYNYVDNNLMDHGMHQHDRSTPNDAWTVLSFSIRQVYSNHAYQNPHNTRMRFDLYSSHGSTSIRNLTNSSTGDSSIYNNSVDSKDSKGLWFIPVIYNSDHGKFYQTNHGLKQGEGYFVTSSANTYTDQTTSVSTNIAPIYPVQASGGTTGNGGTNTTNNMNGTFVVTEADDTGFKLGLHRTNLQLQPPEGQVKLGTNFTLKPYHVKSNQAAATALNHNQFANSNEDFATITIPNHGLNDGDSLVYDQNGGTVVGGLTDGTLYYAATTTANKLRLSSNVIGVHPLGYNPNTGQTNTDWGTIRNVYGTGDTSTAITGTNSRDYIRLRSSGGALQTGELVQYIKTGNYAIPGLINGHFYYVRRWNLQYTYLYQLFLDKDLAERNYTTDPLTGFDNAYPYGRIHLSRTYTWYGYSNVGTIRRTSIVPFSSVGSGTQKLQNTTVGASDGVYKVSSVINNSTYNLTATGQVPDRAFPITGKTDVDLYNNAINKVDHGFTTGSTFTVDNSDIGGLTSGYGTYYAINVSKDWFKVAGSAADADDGTEIDLTSVTTSPTTFSSSSVSGQTPGEGTVSVTSGEIRVTGVDTNFPSKFNTGDVFKIAVAPTLTNISIANGSSGLSNSVFTFNSHGMSAGQSVIVNATTPSSQTSNGQIWYVGNITTNTFTLHADPTNAIAGTQQLATSGGSGRGFDIISNVGSYEEGTIRYVNNITSLELQEAASQTVTSANYMVETSLLMRADGFALHRPYDGGVELVPSTNPDSQMIRQTRKYFRYQSGKGIQNSLAINFSPTTDVDTFSSSGNTGTITTRYAHRLSEGLNITTQGASVSSGLNKYNNSFTVLSVPTDNSFKVAFDTTLVLNTPASLTEGETITQLNSGTTGIVRRSTTNSGFVDLHTVRTPAADVNVAVTVTNPSGSQNVFTFGGTAAPADYSMTENTKYIFNQDDATNDGHPMRIALTRDGTSTHSYSVYKLDGSVVPYSDWSNATTFNAATTRRLEVTFAAYSDNHYYACHFHSGMGNSIITPVASTGTFTTNSSDTLSGSVSGALTPGVGLSTYPTLTVTGPSDTVADGIIGFTVDSWSNSVLRAGLFDDQNGLFWEYDGSTLGCVVRTSTQQLSGFASVVFKDTTVSGTNTKFNSQLNVGEKLIIKGQTYLITDIASDTSLSIIPRYRGVTKNNVILTKTVDNKVLQSNWNIDKCDGTGPSGFVLDKKKIHMAYIDYSWYGAGKVRFGFKDQQGNVMYAHQFVHNNLQTEAYMRSGNVPGRYEIENTGIPTYVPALAHWGTSIIMDGRFDNDKAYVFTASGQTMSLTGETSLVVSGKMSTNYWLERNTSGRFSSLGYALEPAAGNTVYNEITAGKAITGTNAGSNNTTDNPYSYVLTPVQPYRAQKYVYSKSPTYVAGAYRDLIVVDNQPTGNDSTDQNYTITLGATGGVSVTDPIPLISIRLAPSVDNGTPGLLGEREIVNRMQLAMKQVGILTTHAVEVDVILNGSVDNNDWQRVTVPSLSQLIYHNQEDVINGGNTIFSFRAEGGSGTSNRKAVTSTQDLSEISDLGNAILGGNNVFPDGPDVVSIVARLVEDPTTVSSSNPWQISGRVSWAESQA